MHDAADRETRRPAPNFLHERARTCMLLVVAVAIATTGCDGWLDVDPRTVGDDRAGANDSPTMDPSERRDRFGSDDEDQSHSDSSFDERRPKAGLGGLKRLTPTEYDNSLRQLFGYPFGTRRQFGEKFVPSQDADPFPNNFLRQSPTLHLTKSLDRAAEKISETAIEELEASEPMQRHVLGCSVAETDNRECFRTFLENFGRRALRRPLTDDEFETYMTRFFELERLRNHSDSRIREAARNVDFFFKIRLALQTLLQHSEFIYRAETGEPTGETAEGVEKLDDFSMASRLSYFLWGGPPDDTLLDAAASGRLSTADQVRAQARRMLEDPRARHRIYQFHATWLGFQDFWLDRLTWDIPREVAQSMRNETRMLLERIIFEEKNDWRRLFTSEQTYVDRTLADWYGFVSPGDLDEPEGQWVTYPADSKRGGILSHGTFLTNGNGQGGHTKLIRRAALVFERLSCNPIEPAANMTPPENTDPPETDCKFDWFESRTLAGSCQHCHYRLNHTGVGLENFDNHGKYREREPDTEDTCEIQSEEGAFYQPGDDGWKPEYEFSGPGQLGEVLVEHKGVADCMVKHLYEFALGHTARERDKPAIDTLRDQFENDGYRFDKLVLALVGSKAFRFKVDREADANGEPE